ncbi:MAG: hypothetical protein VYD90_12715 [Pseudomonadota bacterium]|nr:hypothetical protein [Pseudomonadota bacterium]
MNDTATLYTLHEAQHFCGYLFIRPVGHITEEGRELFQGRRIRTRRTVLNPVKERTVINDPSRQRAKRTSSSVRPTVSGLPQAFDK